MSYVETVLQPGETIKILGRLHWIGYSRAIILAAIAMVVAYFFYGSAFPGGMAFVAFIAAIAMLEFLRVLLETLTTEIAVTSRRVILKRGLVRRETSEMNMNQIETVNVYQSVLGRILGFGTIHIRGTGEGLAPLPGVAAPLQVRNTIVVG